MLNHFFLTIKEKIVPEEVNLIVGTISSLDFGN